METSNASPVNYLCVQAAETDRCEERHVCLMGILERKGPCTLARTVRWCGLGGQWNQ